MKLLFMDSIESTVYGGMEEWIRLVTAGLASRGHEITVAGRRGSEFLRRIRETTDKASLLELDITGDFRPDTIARIKRHLRGRRIDIVSVNFNKDVRLGGLAARLDGSARVVWSVGLDITKDSFIHRWLTPKLVDGVIVPSDSLRKQITRLGYIPPERVKVIPIGIQDRTIPESRAESAKRLRARYQLPYDCLVAVTSGRLVDQKGHRYLVEAAPAIIEAVPHIRFLLLGNGPLQGDLEEHMERLGVNEHFVFAGMLDDLTLELAGADLMVHPSIEEPFGIAVLEGMRAGLPIVASRVGGIPEVVGEAEAALLVPPADPEELARAVIGVLSDGRLREQMSQSARRRFESDFRYETMIDRLEAYYRSIIQEACHGTA